MSKVFIIVYDEKIACSLENVIPPDAFQFTL